MSSLGAFAAAGALGPVIFGKGMAGAGGILGMGGEAAAGTLGIRGTEKPPPAGLAGVCVPASADSSPANF